MRFVERQLSAVERARFIEEQHFPIEMQRLLGALATSQGGPPPEPDTSDAQLSAILQLEESLGVRFTADFRTYLLFVERHPSEGNVVMSFRDWEGLPPPLSLAQIAEKTRDLRGDAQFDHADEQSDPDPGVRHDWFHHGWVVFAYQSRWTLCVDLAPTPSGREGQILQLHAGEARREKLAPSIFDLLKDALSRATEKRAPGAAAAGRALVAVRAFANDDQPAQVTVAIFVTGGQQPVERGITPFEALLTPGTYSIRAELKGASQWREDLQVHHDGTATPSLVQFFF